MTPPAIAIIPGAGLSRRMGQPKLLLPWSMGGGEGTILERIVATLLQGGVARVFVVARRDDLPLADVVNRTTAELVTPDSDPPDMRASVTAGLHAARDRGLSRVPWLVVPGDHPLFAAETVRRLLAAWHESQQGPDNSPQVLVPTHVFVPTHEGRSGHPTLFSPELAGRMAEIPPDRGLNWFVERDPALRCEVPVDDSGILADLDTPADYERWRPR